MKPKTNPRSVAARSERKATRVVGTAARSSLSQSLPQCLG